VGGRKQKGGVRTTESGQTGGLRRSETKRAGSLLSVPATKPSVREDRRRVPCGRRICEGVNGGAAQCGNCYLRSRTARYRKRFAFSKSVFLVVLHNTHNRDVTQSALRALHTTRVLTMVPLVCRGWGHGMTVPGTMVRTIWYTCTMVAIVARCPLAQWELHVYELAVSHVKPAVIDIVEVSTWAARGGLVVGQPGEASAFWVCSGDAVADQARTWRQTSPCAVHHAPPPQQQAPVSHGSGHGQLVLAVRQAQQRADQD
jgi:hypothetical protein